MKSLESLLRTLTVAFLDHFREKWHRGNNSPEVRTSSLGVNIAPPLPLFCPKTTILDQKVLKTHANINMPISALNVSWISRIPARHIVNGSRNMTVMSYFRLEVEIRHAHWKCAI